MKDEVVDADEGRRTGEQVPLTAIREERRLDAGDDVAEDRNIPRCAHVDYLRTNGAHGGGDACEPPVTDLGKDSEKTKISARARDGAGKTLSRSSHVTTTIELPELASDVEWQWKHRTGFRNYTDDAARRIERAFNIGESKVRLKTGKTKTTPMEIFFGEMIQYDPISKNTREVRRLGANPWYRRWWRHTKQVWRTWQKGHYRPETFLQYQARRDAIEAREERRDPEKPSIYKDAGVVSGVVRSSVFTGVMFVSIFLDVIWIAVELDHNSKPEHDVACRIVENVFCVVFLVEYVIRFIALKKKQDCVLNLSFCWMGFLVLLSIFEHWVVPVLLAIFGKNIRDGVFRNNFFLRLTRLVRLTRVTRLMSAMPQVMTLMTGIVSAFRPVFFTLMLLIAIIFVFAVIFRSATDNTNSGKEYFGTVNGAMWILLIHGTFLDGIADVVNALLEDKHTGSCMLLFMYVILSSCTILNMLIGILCEIVADNTREKDIKDSNSYLKNHLLDILECYDKDGDMTLGIEEFRLLTTNPEVINTLQNFGTEVSGLMTLCDVLFAADTGNSVSGRMSFEEFIAVVMRLRGKTGASVTDIVELREYMRQQLVRSFGLLDRGQSELKSRLGHLPCLRSTSTELGEPSIERTVLVELTFNGKMRSVAHAASTTVAQLVAAHLSPRHGRLQVVDASDVILGEQLTLGSLMTPSATTLPLQVRSVVW
eukprot:TRINITY_DN70238_c0_g1_i1.p1 TRINITY_DN70238_c0_g1~~TRINITY_DN70238_c0_g1_i1.p1  ORF type:complete len:709 (+),score=106.70 TRINITY_DN70238_c0_g1_i1:46-2172(+)